MTARASSWILAGWLVIAAPSIAWPQPGADDITRQPYAVRLVVLFSDHRFLSSETFRDQFPRELTQRTQRALGSLVRAEVAASHPLGETIRREGLDAVLTAHREVSTRRTWFFTIDFQGGLFVVRGRFFDGWTGMPGPPARTVTTSDRDRLPRLLAAMVAEPFPLSGQVRGEKDGDVTVALFGGQASDTVRLPVGTTFAIAQVGAKSGAWRSERMPWAILETKESPSAGVVTCRFWHRFAGASLASSGEEVFRVLAMPTRTGPLRLQVLDKSTGQPLAGIVARIQTQGSKDRELVTDAAGRITTPEPIARLAIVTLSRGGATLAQFPAPIVDDRPIVCEVSTNPAAEARAGIEIRRRQFLARMLETHTFVDQQIGELGVLLRQSLEKSRDHAQRTLAVLDREIRDLETERRDIGLLLKANGAAGFTDGDKGMNRLRSLRGVMADSLVRIDQAMSDREAANEKQKQAAKWVVEAELAYSQAKFPTAIDLYRRAADLLGGPSKVRTKLEDLERSWKVKDASHERARQYLMETWPTVEIERLKDHFEIASEALRVCREAKDGLTPRCFLQANIEHLAKIGKVVAALNQSRSPDDRQRLQGWNDVLSRLRQISSDALTNEPPTEPKK